MDVLSITAHFQGQAMTFDSVRHVHMQTQCAVGEKRKVPANQPPSAAASRLPYTVLNNLDVNTGC